MAFQTVDEYIASAPSQVQSKLKELQALILEAIPEAVEKISYGMPYYGYKGPVIYFAYAKKHIGLYIPPPIIPDHQQDLKGYQTSKSTVRLPLDQPLPILLIKKLIKASILRNDQFSKI